VNAARDAILAGIRSSLKRGPLDPQRQAELHVQVAAHRRNLIPARATALDDAGRIDLFAAMAEDVQATVARVPSPAAVPEAVAHYLAAENLPAELAMAPDRNLDDIPWGSRPLLRIRRGRAEAADVVGLTPCFAAVAETGTLMLVSGAQTPTTLNFLPDTHMVLVHADQVVATYEDGWDRLRRVGSAAHRQLHHRAVAHRGHRAAHRAGCARASPSPYPRRRKPPGREGWRSKRVIACRCSRITGSGLRRCAT
jgi:L-lactate dehydrogenase complex protein LldG